MEKYALQNAVRHGGRAEVGAVVSKVLGDAPALRALAREVARVSAEVVKAVNALTVQQQELALKEKYPEAVQEHRQEQRVGLAPLEGAVKGAFVVRLPPEPSGFMHIGHAMAGTINDVYKQMYDGKLWLRFEDTNPRKVQKRYYESFRKGYTWLGIEWDYEKNVSSDIDLLYEHIQDLIEAGIGLRLRLPARADEEAQVRGDRLRAQGADRREERRRLVRDARKEAQGGDLRDTAQGRPRQPRLLAQGPEHRKDNRLPPPPHRGEVHRLADLRLRGRRRGPDMHRDPRPEVIGVPRGAAGARQVPPRVPSDKGHPVLPLQLQGDPRAEEAPQAPRRGKAGHGLGRPEDADDRGRRAAGHPPGRHTSVHHRGRLHQVRAHLRLVPALRCQQEDARPGDEARLLRPRPGEAEGRGGAARSG